MRLHKPLAASRGYRSVSPHWHIYHVRVGDERLRIPAFSDHESSMLLAQKLQSIADHITVGADVDGPTRDWLMCLPERIRKSVGFQSLLRHVELWSYCPILSLIDEWAEWSITEKGVSERYVKNRTQQVRRVFVECKLFTWREADSDAGRAKLDMWLDRTDWDAARVTKANLETAVHSFCLWLSGAYRPVRSLVAERRGPGGYAARRLRT